MKTSHSLVLPLFLIAVFTVPIGLLAQSQPRNLSGIYPHLTVYGIYSENEKNTQPGHDECGIGAIVPWGGKLGMVNYAPHKPRGSEHKSFSIDADLNMVVHPQSVGGTPAGRMIHDESKQLFIAHDAVGEDGTVREITNGRWMMDMHGMFFDFPATFSATDTRGIRPIGSHLRYIPAFCEWNGQLVLASDETSIQGNPLAGQPQSNLWFGTDEDLKSWGPANGYGGPWKSSTVLADKPSDAYLMTGYGKKTLVIQSDVDTKILVEVDIDHQTGWHSYRALGVKAGVPSVHTFPTALSAHWVRLTSSTEAMITAKFTYE